MGRSGRLILVPLALTLLILSPTLLAQQSGPQQGQIPFFPSGQWSDQPRRLQRGQQAQNECQIDRLSASEPSIRYEAEAGVTEVWDTNEQQELECAGVIVVRQQVEPKGLVLPHYHNAPSISYVIRGKGLLGVSGLGCADTYESGSESRGSESRGSESRRSERGSEGERDQHQKVRRFHQGHIIAIPAGFSRWAYNDGEETLTIVTLYDTSNFQNQLDNNLRSFFLAGNSEGSRGEQQSPRRHSEQSRRQGHESRREEEGSSRREEESSRREEESRREEQEQRRGEESSRRGRHQSRRPSHQEGAKNILNGFRREILANAFQVSDEIIKKLQGKNDDRGFIVRVEGDIQMLIPEWDLEEEQESSRRRHRNHHQGRRGGEYNGLEETICSAKLNENIDNPERADIFNPQAGRLTSINSLKLPVLSYLRLSAEKVNLYQDAIFAPNWKINAHSIVYFTKGSGRVQVASNEGNLVFDDTVQEGQLLVIPQNFVVVKKADRDGLEWVSFLTNDRAMNNPLAGRISAIRGLPVEVVMNSYGLSREEARKLKYGRREISVFSPSSQSQRRQEKYAIM